METTTPKDPLVQARIAACAAIRLVPSPALKFLAAAVGIILLFAEIQRSAMVIYLILAVWAALSQEAICVAVCSKDNATEKHGVRILPILLTSVAVITQFMAAYLRNGDVAQHRLSSLVEYQVQAAFIGIAVLAALGFFSSWTILAASTVASVYRKRFAECEAEMMARDVPAADQVVAPATQLG